MSSEEVELRDLLSQALESNGCLAKIRAQLRANIFLALDEDSKINKQRPLLNDKVKSFLELPQGQLMFCIVREFLEYFDLDFSLSVYETESYLGSGYKYEGKRKILDELDMQAGTETAPILLQLIKLAQNKPKSANIEEKHEKVVIHDENENRTNNVKEENINLNCTYILNGSGGTAPNVTINDNSNGCEEMCSDTEGSPTLVNLDITGEVSSLRQNDKKSKNLSDISPIQLNNSKSRVGDILPSLCNKEFKEKVNLKEVERLFDMEVEYEEDFMSSIEMDLSLCKSNHSNEETEQSLKEDDKTITSENVSLNETIT